ncbi:MAG TPA: DUF4350 domain-containing protein [Verrucomicrobiae bacterium]|nr:DUF4350 domain-containing protein [Verrucomicrobiae bacterium]
MSRRIVETAVLVALLGVLVLLATGSMGEMPSVPSSYDTGPNGYRALYDVLAREGIPVTRLEAPLGLMDRNVRVLALTASAYDRSDVRRLQSFLSGGGTVLAFGHIRGLTKSPRLHSFSVANYSNLALSKHPQRASEIYATVAGKGVVAFDERAYGYDRTRSLWSVLPPAVHVAVALAALALLLALIDANVRFAPPIVREPPADRDSSDYLRSMASLLRRAHAGRAAIERFARVYPKSAELEQLAAATRPSDALVLRAATIFAKLRKDQS